MEGEQSVTFKDGDLITDLLDKYTIAETKFLKWMEFNKNHPEAGKYLYAEFPRHYVWDKAVKSWKDRKMFNNKVGRIYHGPIKTGPLYYMRIMLNHVRGTTCFEDIRTVNGVVYPSYRDACYSLGLLEGDKEYIHAIREVSFWGSDRFLRHLFSMLLQSDSMSRPSHVWGSTWEFLTNDILYNRRRMFNSPGMSL